MKRSLNPRSASQRPVAEWDPRQLTSIQTELWVSRAASAVAFYQAAFGAVVVHEVGAGDDIVAQLEIGGAAFWVSEADAGRGRLDPRAVNGTTSRTLLVVEDPDARFRQALASGATEVAAVGDEHGWRIGRLVDPFGHEWEVGRPLIPWPPAMSPDSE
jgi:PhnB protein